MASMRTSRCCAPLRSANSSTATPARRILAGKVAQAYRGWQDIRRQLAALETGAQALAAEREQLDWQEKELDALAFRAGEWDELQTEHRRLAHAASLIEAVQFGLDVLSEERYRA